MTKGRDLRYPQGSQWNKWDLHVHTPMSVIQNYGGDTKEAWERFFCDIESLPSEFKVLGINDYIFVDGYRKVLKAKKKGRLQNIDLLLPVIEVRLDKFGGSKSQLSRVNYHIVFSDEVSPDTIEHHFLYALSNSFQLSPEGAAIAGRKRWSSNITRASIEELGRCIIETTPEVKRTGNLSPLFRGFSNLTFRLEDIQEKLSFHHFEDQYLTAVGKTEWADIEWNYQTPADKKHTINSVDMVFVSSRTPEAWRKAKDSLRESGVNDLLLDCSDAHYFSEEPHNDRIGECNTWIKAAPTFAGLKHALREPDERIFVGEEPEKLKLVRENKTKYVESLHIQKTSELLDEVWFSGELTFNSDLIAIIGNKGSGKSALADVLGLLGDTRQHRAFSFLNKDKFRHPQANKARHFDAELGWRSGKQVTKNLNDPVVDDAVEAIKYIPQSFLETICNEVASGGEDFRKQLEAVIFSHVGDADRLGTDSLAGLIEYKTRETYAAIDVQVDELRAINTRVINLEIRSTAEHKKALENRLASKQAELAAHDELRPVTVPEPQNDPETEKATGSDSLELQRIKLWRELWSELVRFEEEIQKEATLLCAAVERVSKGVDNLERRYTMFEEDMSDELNDIGINFKDIAELKVNRSRLDEEHKLYRSLRERANGFLDASNPKSHVAKRDLLDRRVVTLQEQLDEASRRYEDYLIALEAWRHRRSEIIGHKDAVSSIEHLAGQLRELSELPARLQKTSHLRAVKSREIFQEITKLASTYSELYGPVQEFIEEHPLAKDKFDLNFQVAIVEKDFGTRFFEQVSRARSGSFYGGAEISTLLDEILERHNFNEAESVMSFLDEITDRLHHDTRTENRQKVKVSEQLRQGHTVQSLYDFLFSLDCLKPRYTLRMGDKDLQQLSPGERGTLLLIFYLLIDKNDVPLIIDQPEENLDNHTVFDLLVPCVKEAKKRRQIFLVTHNPNLAVVCDAEQIVRASIDRKDGNKITYTSGPLEDLRINEMAMDILEGTRPAFDNRTSKYRTELDV